jgi:hypothetical protein
MKVTYWNWLTCNVIGHKRPPLIWQFWGAAVVIPTNPMAEDKSYEHWGSAECVRCRRYAAWALSKSEYKALHATKKEQLTR